jgi:hypothetical protein
VEAKLTRLTHKIGIQLHPVAESCTICSSRSRWPVRKLLDTLSYVRPSVRPSFEFQPSLRFQSQNLGLSQCSETLNLRWLGTPCPQIFYYAIDFGFRMFLVGYLSAALDTKWRLRYDTSRRECRRKRTWHLSCSVILPPAPSNWVHPEYEKAVLTSIPRRAVVCKGVSRSFRTGRLERELQIVQLSSIRCSCIAILWVSLASFAAITLCVASQRVLFVSLSTQSGNFWIHPCIFRRMLQANRICVWARACVCYHLTLISPVC